MKKALILCVALSTTLFTSAQESQAGFTSAAAQEVKPVRLGFAVSPALTWLASETKQLGTQGQRLGFSYGVTVDFTIAQSNNYSLATGFLISHTGGKLQYADAIPRTNNGPFESAQTAIDAKLQYINIPFTLKLKTNEIGYMSYFGQFGVLAGVKMGAKQNGTTTFDNDLFKKAIENESYKAESRLFNAGLLIGIGAEYNISGGTNLIFGINYFRGFTNVLDFSTYNTNDTNNVLFNDDGTPSKGPRAVGFLNHVALSLGVIF